MKKWLTVYMNRTGQNFQCTCKSSLFWWLQTRKGHFITTDLELPTWNWKHLALYIRNYDKRRFWFVNVLFFSDDQKCYHLVYDVQNDFNTIIINDDWFFSVQLFLCFFHERHACFTLKFVINRFYFTNVWLTNLPKNKRRTNDSCIL